MVESLTAAQRTAVEHIDGPLLILAGPGSGKTRVVTHRVANMLSRGVEGRSILALTFTNKAADEMQRRLETLAPGASVWMGTFHKFCATLLRQYAAHVGLSQNFTIYDTSDSFKALKLAIETAELKTTEFTPDRVARGISWAKTELITPAAYRPALGSPLAEAVAKIYPGYQHQLLASNAVDFDDLLLHVAILLRENAELRATLDDRYRYILVDEYQDTNRAQYAIVRALSVDHPNLAATGDPDQSIYGWRGANIKNILEFEQDFPDVRVVRLEQNYRSTKNILGVADALIANNKRRKKKTLFTENPVGRPVRLQSYLTQREEAEGVAMRIADGVRQGRTPRDFAVFYRTNALSRAFEEAFHEFGLPFQIINGVEFYQRKEIKDVVAYLRLLNNPQDDVAFLRIVNTPPRGIGKTTLQRLREFAVSKQLSLLEAASQAADAPKLAKRAVAALAKFTAVMHRLQTSCADAVEEVVGRVLTESGYRDFLAESDTQEDQERLENVEELLTVAREFDERNPQGAAIEQFLEQSSLVGDTDVWESSNDCVSLMTLHGAKGLEFPSVLIVAVEESILPHKRSMEDPQQLEEERRLFFVGITRAKEELQISLADNRAFRGERYPTIASSFLRELPQEFMDVDLPSAAAYPYGDFSDGAFSADACADDVYVDDAGAASDPKTITSEVANPALLVTTAAKLSNASKPGSEQNPANSAGVSPDVFALGMTVLHPEYGPGKIAALSGEGRRRRATVQFAAGAGERKFMLAQSPLRPISKK